MSCPSISIVVPNLNSGSTLEATLQSLFNQDYPNLEILVVDGGSTDNSLEIIHRYRDRLAWWISEKDTGQSNAINKGFARSRGEIINWLCSDDLLTSGALRLVGSHFAENPGADILFGSCKVVSLVNGQEELWMPKLAAVRLMPCFNPIPQPSCFYRRKLIRRWPAVDETCHWSMDFELWCYFKSRGAKFDFTPQTLSIFQTSSTNKTTVGGEKRISELERIYRTYTHEKIPLIFWHRRLRFPIEKIRQLHRDNKAIFYLTRFYTGMFSRIFGLFYGTERVKSLNWEWMLRPPA